ncbi:MAG: prolyl oligopeptidase family serine peptidase [Paludisphaera borealis]|uniref:alpha/beta hydrolase family protein n=1 Tax=Paludisphaera borealis TaxID=1387353 RepID=UPI00284C3F6F|nr:prolyl oligopeptidase family serine peptidase [Paludisphaera borealis]MDR3619575.1 prolyl oligopeptidase family serine peptidase [Paludisphaera borealis]
MFLSCLVIWAGVAVSAVDVDRGEVDFRPGPEEGSVPAPFRLEPAIFAYERTRVFSTPRYTVSRLTFPSPIESPDAANNVVHAEYFAPVGFSGKRPAVVVLHILGSDFPLSRYMAARLADRGVAALFVKLPYYGERRPTGGPGPVPRKFLSDDIERSMRSMRQGVCDVRRAGRWLATRPDVDPDRLGVTGISLGGIVSSLVVSVDPQIRSGALLLAGGDLSKVLWDMPETAPFRKMWTESGRTVDDLKRLTDPYDPLTYAAGMAGKRVLMIAGNVDEVVPPASAKALWEAGGKPPIVWYDCGHYSAVGYLLPAIRQTVDFLGGGDPPRPADSRASPAG